MSTKIYSAFRLNSDINLFQWMEKLRTVLIPEIEKQVSEMYVQTAVLRWDQTEGKSFPEVLNEVLADSKKDDSGYYPERYFNASASLLWNPVRNQVYMMLHDTPHEMNQLVLDMQEVIGDFSYWDNSDSQVEELGYDGWKDRLKAWKETLDFNSSITSQSLQIKFFDLYAKHLFSVDLMKSHWVDIQLPSYEKRFADVFAHVFLKRFSLSQDDMISFVSRVSRKPVNALDDVAAFFGATETEILELKAQVSDILATKKQIVL